MASYYDPTASTRKLLSAIKECQQAWGDDPAFSDALYKLRLVERQLDTVLASPGERAARRAAGPNQTGQPTGEYTGGENRG